MRVAAMVSEDPDLIYSYRNGIDMHSLNAKVCFNIVTDLTEIIEQVEKMGLVPESEQWKLEVLKRELNIIKDIHGDKRTAAKSVSFGKPIPICRSKTRSIAGKLRLMLCQSAAREGRDAFKWFRDSQCA